MNPKRPETRFGFHIAILCALTIEADAVEAIFDQYWDNGAEYDKPPGDLNAYSIGSIGRHHVVLAHMPGMGKANAAMVAANCRTTFPNIKLALVVGVCGGVPFAPDTNNEIVLGDVTLSNGVVQYDFGRRLPERFVPKNDSQPSLDTEIRSLLGKLGGIRSRNEMNNKIVSHLATLQEEPELQASYPGISQDTLFEAAYRHLEDGKTCGECGCNGPLVPRRRFDQGTPQPKVHFGLIASGDTVMKSGEDRDAIAKQQRVIGFEMESAGMWDIFPCIVIKGACDYADSHKSKMWQRYAAATAAACTKAFLEYWTPTDYTSTPSKQEPFSIPFSLPLATDVSQFVGRKQELAAIHAILARGNGRRTVVVHGLGGIGKTQLTVAYLKAHHSRYSAVFWLNAKDESSLRQSFVRVAERIFQHYPSSVSFKAALDSRDPDKAVRAVKRWLDEPKNGGWLLACDNYDTPSFEKDDDPIDAEGWVDVESTPEEAIQAYDIRPFLPSTYHGAVIITTRSSNLGIGESIPLKKLTDINDSLKILSSTSKRQDTQTDENAIQLAKRLDGLPLALATAGAYMHQVPISWAEYAKFQQESWLRLQQTSPKLRSYEDRALYSTWDISYRQIERESKAAAMMLHIWGYLSNEDVWYEMLQHIQKIPSAPECLVKMVESPISFHQVMRVLSSHGLAEPDSKEWGIESRGYSVHECVHSWMTHVLNMAGGFGLYPMAASCAASHIANRREGEDSRLERRLLLHVNTCFTHGSKLLENEDSAGVAHAFGRFYSRQGLFNKARVMHSIALSHYEILRGKDHLLTLIVRDELGVVYGRQGKYSEAEAMHARALEDAERVLGPGHNLTNSLVHNLGMIYRSQNRLEEAEKMYNRVLESCEKTLGPDHTKTLLCVHNLGLLYRSQERYVEAERMYNRVLQGSRRAPGSETQQTIDIFHNLGVLYRVQGRYEEAEDMFRQALRGCERMLGPDHTSTLSTVHAIGILYELQERHEEAERMQSRALQGYEKALGSDVSTSPSALDVMQRLGDAFCKLNKPNEALSYYSRVRVGVEAVFGRESGRYEEIDERLKHVCNVLGLEFRD